jgi:poly-gamma-glutamate synthesis protein (capsule biosynthesis protein)
MAFHSFIEQILPHPGDPLLHESYVNSALKYVSLAEETNGPISRPVGFDYIWGVNWGYGIPDQHKRFAHQLIDDAGVDIVHGHSSHHPKGIEVYKNKPIIYGCGDLLNDYEGIGRYAPFRADLALMYLPTIDSRL